MDDFLWFGVSIHCFFSSWILFTMWFMWMWFLPLGPTHYVSLSAVMHFPILTLFRGLKNLLGNEFLTDKIVSPKLEKKTTAQFYFWIHNDKINKWRFKRKWAFVTVLWSQGIIQTFGSTSENVWVNERANERANEREIQRGGNLFTAIHIILVDVEMTE